MPRLARALIYVNAARLILHNVSAMARFAITVLLSLGLVLWNLPEFQRWGRRDRNTETLARSEHECVERLKVSTSDPSSLKAKILSKLSCFVSHHSS